MLIDFKNHVIIYKDVLKRHLKRNTTFILGLKKKKVRRTFRRAGSEHHFSNSVSSPRLSQSLVSKSLTLRLSRYLVRMSTCSLFC